MRDEPIIHPPGDAEPAPLTLGRTARLLHFACAAGLSYAALSVLHVAVTSYGDAAYWRSLAELPVHTRAREEAEAQALASARMPIAESMSLLARAPRSELRAIAPAAGEAPPVAGWAYAADIAEARARVEAWRAAHEARGTEATP